MVHVYKINSVKLYNILDGQFSQGYVWDLALVVTNMSVLGWFLNLGLEID